ncbi:MAG: helix-turn-helix transcriptional regulator [bacterium]|nr:helix-turn-helix transcriptional regulator [bacterium]
MDLATTQPQRDLSEILTPSSLCFIRTGAMRLTHGSGDYAIVDANHVLFGAPAAPVRPLTDHCCCTIVQFSAVALNEPALRIRLVSPLLYIRHWMLLQRAHHRRHSVGTTEADALELLGDVIREPAFRDWQSSVSADETQRRRRTIALHVTAVLHASLSNPLSLESVARSASLSRFTLSRLFSEYAGVSMRVYYRRLRLRNALDAMLDKRIDLTAIATNLGFSDQAHFTNAFRAEYGMSPSDIRRAMKGNNLQASFASDCYDDPGE